MSRRGGRERYRGRDARRGVFKDGYQDIARPTSAIWPTPPTFATGRQLRASATPIDCNHGVPWIECTTCSPARKR